MTASALRPHIRVRALAIAWATALVLLTASAAAGSERPAADIQSAEAWPPGTPEAPVADRVDPAPAALVSYLRAENRRYRIRQKPRAATARGTLAADIRQAIASMPQAVRALVSDKLIGVFTVRDLGSTAWAEAIADADGSFRRGIVVLDLQAIDKRGNTWITWRESTPFRPAPGFAMRGRIAAAESPGRVDAIRYILLHEFAHVASIGAGYLPDWSIDSLPADQACDHAFVCLSWTRYDLSGRHTRFEPAFADRPPVAYYRPAEQRLAADLALPLYRWLAQTDFVSLYATVSPHEDFAESFANFVHSQLLGLPYAVEVLDGGVPVAAAEPCWNEARCAAKRAFLERVLGDAGG